MSLETLFAIANFGVLPAWALLALAPGWVFTDRLVHAVWIPLLLGLLYATLLVVAEPPEGASFGSLAGVMAFFTSPVAALAGWVHYLVFDLFVGAWEVRDARRLGVHHGLVVVCLAVTLMAGPAGLLLYLVIRLARTRSTTLVEMR